MTLANDMSGRDPTKWTVELNTNEGLVKEAHYSKHAQTPERFAVEKFALQKPMIVSDIKFVFQQNRYGQMGDTTYLLEGDDGVNMLQLNNVSFFIQKSLLSDQEAQLKRMENQQLKADIEARVKQGGGKMADQNSICFSIMWDEKVDLDLHCLLPNGADCNYSAKTPANYITLDVDKKSQSQGQVENIVLNTPQCADGEYKYFVRYFDGHGRPCNFKFMANQFGRVIQTGTG